jgi:uncharacterized protein YdbL (DUF1318 family)
VRRGLPLACAALLAAGAGLSGCAPTVTVATDKPIEIRIALDHEVRVKLDPEVEDLVSRESAAGAVRARGLSDDVALGDASEVQAAKRARTLGERSDGYLGVVPPGSEAARALAERVNAERRAGYQSLASRYAVPLAEVEKVAAVRRLEQAALGESIQTPDGHWITKSETLRVEVSG